MEAFCWVVNRSQLGLEVVLGSLYRGHRVGCLFDALGHRILGKLCGLSGTYLGFVDCVSDFPGHWAHSVFPRPDLVQGGIPDLVLLLSWLNPVPPPGLPTCIIDAEPGSCWISCSFLRTELPLAPLTWLGRQCLSSIPLLAS